MNKKEDMLYLVFFCILLGFFIGILFKTPYTAGIKTFFHNICIKMNPDSQKDTKTLIIDKVTKDSVKTPRNSIFENQQPKENKFILFIKKITGKKSEKTQTIYDSVLY